MSELEPPPPDRRAGPPRFAVRLAPPDLGPWLAGNVLPGVWSFAAPEPGPHVALVSLMHGNEIGGAIVLERWLRAGLRPRRGRLTLIFANLDAFARFDPSDPTASRYVDEDMNRVWCLRQLDGPRRTAELRRARALRPVLDSADIVLDLHSMLWPSDPLVLTGEAPQAADLALGLGLPSLVVADAGHAAGRRLIDYARFQEPGRAAILLEAGAHWEPSTTAVMEQVAAQLLRRHGLAVDGAPLPPAAEDGAAAPVLARVTRTVTANTTAFGFLRPYRGGEVVERRNTVIALDGETEIRTPHDDCLLVMPSLRTPRGHTAVRLAQFVAR
ncbi:succinylglutamate desuccinylase/aspartoacylase family protein [Roseomonas sp. NAR14]|uniref:Succinylglutamate desuccinylase/aspartoacylase family protein n=1 Tax=Roseomonas acroporae TaxID=2937791 RepID=A0A9X1YAU0_9PROT|nr:succinylglutamate desuccinylase/aspartoacylase family protein [Roseomonas acroporae]MCK8783076.1 succinylglutamate desuccinylase/aspartoacylase family protein [Roseomonas acroporae]